MNPPSATARLDGEIRAAGPPLAFEVGVMLLLTLISGGLRLWRLGDWALDGDEVITLSEAFSLGVPDRLGQARHAMLWGTLLHQLYSALQSVFPMEPTLALRVVPALCGVLMVPLLHTLVRPLLGPWPALSAALLVAFSPLHFYFSTFGGAPSCVFLLAGAGSLLVLLGVQRSRRGSLLAGVLLLVLAVEFHRSAGLAVLGTLAALLVLKRESPALRRLSIGLLVLVLLLIPLLVSLRLGTEGWALTQEMARASTAAQNPVGLVASLLHDLGLAVPLLAALGLGVAWRRREPLGAALLVVFLVPLLALFLLSGTVYVGVQHLAAAIPCLMVLSGLGLGEMLRLLEGRNGSRLAVLVLALVPGLPVFLSQQIDNSRYDVAHVSKALRQVHRPGEPVFAETHRLTQHYSGIPCQELPPTGRELRARLPGDERAFVILHLQRGRAVGTRNASLQPWVEANLRLLARSAPKRLDMHRFETRLYLWQPLHEAAGE